MNIINKMILLTISIIIFLTCMLAFYFDAVSNIVWIRLVFTAIVTISIAYPIYIVGSVAKFMIILYIAQLESERNNYNIDDIIKEFIILLETYGPNDSHVSEYITKHKDKKYTHKLLLNVRKIEASYKEDYENDKK